MANNNAAIFAIFTIAISTLISVFLVNGQMLLYLNHLHITSRTDASFYVQLAATQALFRIPSSLILGWCSAYYGPTRILISLLFVAAFGVIVIMISRPSPIFLFIGFVLFCESYTSRQFRVSILADLVSPENRTPVFVLHAAMRHIAYMLGPALWILIQKWQGSLDVSGYTVDRFTMSHLTAAISFLITGFLVHATISPSRSDDSGQLEETVCDETTPLNPIPSIGAPTTSLTAPDVASALHLPVILSLRSSCIIITSVTEVSFQPIMVDIFGAGDAELGHLYMLAAIVGITISCTQSWISHRFSDYTVVLVGVALIMVGQLLNMPIFGDVQKWQIIVAYILSSRAVVLPSAVLSIFTKHASSPAQKEKGIALCNSSGNVVRTVVRFLLAHHVLSLFGKRVYLMLSLPLLISTMWFILSWRRHSIPA